MLPAVQALTRVISSPPSQACQSRTRLGSIKAIKVGVEKSYSQEQREEEARGNFSYSLGGVPLKRCVCGWCGLI